jgi:hypothetical protein
VISISVPSRTDRLPDAPRFKPERSSAWQLSTISIRVFFSGMVFLSLGILESFTTNQATDIFNDLSSFQSGSILTILIISNLYLRGAKAKYL